MKDENLIITKANKGDSVVLMPTTNYLEMAHEHVNGNKIQITTGIPNNWNRVQIYELPKNCKANLKKIINTYEFNRLKAGHKTETQIIYFLPKIHKTPLKLRPIVSCTKGPMEEASAFLDRLLQPHMRKIKSCIKSSTDLINMLERLEVPPSLSDYFGYRKLTNSVY